MFGEADLRKLAEMSSPDRAFLSIYLAGPASVKQLDKKLTGMRRVLKGGGEAAKDEREYFDRNVDAVKKHLKKNPLESGGLCLFSCWALDYLETVPVPTPATVKDLVWIDSSPFIRPLAELQDEYENVAVVVADNKKARVYIVSSAVAQDETSIAGNVKNHVKKGGWSQQRYERRRDKELLLYAKEIGEKLLELEREEHFRRVLLVGGKEALRVIEKHLPSSVAQKVVGTKALHLGDGGEAMQDDIWKIFFEEERASEQRLWEKIRTEYLRGGLGTVGLEEVLYAAQHGRVDRMVVTRSFAPKGARCRDCGELSGRTESCEACGSASVFEVGLVNEIVELLHTTGAEVDFVDPIDTLTEAGEIAALLRY